MAPRELGIGLLIAPLFSSILAVLVLVLTPILPLYGRSEEEMLAAGDDRPVPQGTALAEHG